MCFRKRILLGAVCLVLPACSTPAPYPPLETVEFVDIERYLGKWYEIASIPTSFTSGCTGTTAEYTLLDDGRVGVVNQCCIGDPSGRLNRIEGTACVVNCETNAQLSVCFRFFGTGDYWIIDLDEDYQWAVVGEPSRRTLFILSRTPTLDDEIYQGILSRLPEQCYDPDRLQLTVQPPECSE
jgi:apolipoprotein D and lipocalin family protein